MRHAGAALSCPGCGAARSSCVAVLRWSGTAQTQSFGRSRVCSASRRKSFVLRCARETLRLQRLTAQQLRHVAGETCGLADEDVLERRQAVDQTEADVAQEAEHVRA